MRHTTRHRRSSRKVTSTKRRSLSAKNGRNNFRRSKREGSVYHFKERVDGGTINTGSVAPGTNGFSNSGGMIIRLTDLPMYQNMAGNFEFARLNKCTIEFLPKFNMAINALANGSGALSSGSITGTMTTAVDQVPFYTANAASGYTLAPTWLPDNTTASGVTNASFVELAMTPDYVRGLERSKEKELYKKQTISFYPAFYDYVVTGAGTGAITNVTNPIPTVVGSTPSSNFQTNGTCERKIKKWVNIANHVTNGNSSTEILNVGPLYFGPIYSLDVNVPGSTGNVPIFDVRLTYSVSFKRYRGVS